MRITEQIDQKVATLNATKMVVSDEKIKKKPRESWLKEYKLLGLSYPTVSTRAGARKRFQI